MHRVGGIEYGRGSSCPGGLFEPLKPPLDLPLVVLAVQVNSFSPLVQIHI